MPTAERIIKQVKQRTESERIFCKSLCSLVGQLGPQLILFLAQGWKDHNYLY